MNFAKNILGKYGWKEGDGLGKEKQGIKQPIKAKLKFDQAGLGSDPSREFSNNWWERAFNDAAKNVKVKKQKNGDVSVDLKDPQNSVEVTTKGYSTKKSGDSMYSKHFLSENAEICSFATIENKTLTDEELFRACGGRTAHKGARHGLKLSGKLARLEQQEKELLAKMQARENEQKTEKNNDIINSRLSKNQETKKNGCEITKKKKRKSGNDEQIDEIQLEENSSKHSKKRKKITAECSATIEKIKSKKKKHKD